MNARLVISVATISPTIIVVEMLEPVQVDVRVVVGVGTSTMTVADPPGPAGIVVVDISDPVQVEVIIVKIVAISNITEPISMHS